MSKRGAVAIVTGGGRGIGQVAAQALAADGIAVAVVARTRPEVERTAADIRDHGGQAAAVARDVGSAYLAGQIVAEAERQLGGPCEILVNAAGVTGPVGEVGEVGIDQWKATLDVNLTGAFAMARAVLPAMKARGSGRIINVISGLAHRAQPGLGAYCASKAALLHLTRVIDAETSGAGVRAFAIEPGLVMTAMNRLLMSLEPAGVRASVIGMLKRLQADPGFVDAEEPAQLIRLAATGQADDLAGEACSIYDPGVRARVRAAASKR